jgi:outer membrane protein TolC
VTQRLPYGGTISARALARATEDLHSRVADGDNQSAEFILAADIPLLRGSGLTARESRIQSERNLIYAAREFENFRRDFLFDIVRDFLDLVVSQRSVVNAERRVVQLRDVEARERGLYESGRSDLFNAALAEQSTVNALDSLNQRREQYRLDVDRFKVRLGLDVEQPVEIVESSLGLPVPQVELDEAVRAAMAYRLDLQTQRDAVDDARRGVAIARNDLLPDLNFTGSVLVPTDDNRDWYRLEPGETVIRAGVTLGLPINREIERLTLRQSQIQLERSERDFDDLRDNITVSVRGAVRQIDRARYTLEIQERSIKIGEDRIESIAAAPDRATARDASEAADELLSAKDSRDEALRDLELAILGYLQQTGQLRVTLDGQMQALQGMAFIPPEQRRGAAINAWRRDMLTIPGFMIIPRPPAVLRRIPGEGE